MSNAFYLVTYLSCLGFNVFGDSGDECNANGTIYNTGEMFQPENECVKITCLGNNTYFALNCTIPTPRAGYSLSGYNLSLAYPYCCPQLVHNVVNDPASYCHHTNSSEVFQPSGTCHLETCQDGNNTLVQKCIKFSVLLGYTLDKGNPSLPFPECCPRPVPVMAPTNVPTTTTCVQLLIYQKAGLLVTRTTPNRSRCVAPKRFCVKKIMSE
uniref:Single domain-containing protein n=1 Tax=Graphocephala atropunctata TaxID=36148 RepID=A0A1B6KSQ1_9HEMI